MKTYYKLNGDFWINVSNVIEPDRGCEIINISCQSLPEGSYFKTGNKLRKLGISHPSNLLNYVYKDDRVLAIMRVSKLLRMLVPVPRKCIQEKASLCCERFRRLTRQRLMEFMFSSDATIHSVLKALTEYAFFYEYSLWLFNPDTEYFTHACSSFSVEKTFLHKDDPTSPLGEVLNADDKMIEKPVDHNSVNSKMLADMKWVNRFTVRVKAGKTGKETIAVFSLYSPFIGYNLRESTKKTITEVLTLEFSKTILTHLFQYNALVDKLHGQPDLPSVRERLQSFVESVAFELGYEAVSIFLIPDLKATQLILMALEENKRRSVATLNVSYPISGSSMTSSVFSNQIMRFSYQINKEKDNSHIFDENTKSTPTNWIGIPIIASDRQSLGVLRAKNKFQDGKIEHFTTLDVLILNNLAFSLGFVYRNALALAREQAENERRQIEYEQLAEFLKTFRHEIKSPLTVVAEAPGLVKRVLRNEGICDEEHLPRRVVNLLSDLEMIGTRLVFVAQALTFDAEQLVKGVSTRQLFQDVVAPVLAFAIPYAAKRGKKIIVDKDSLLRRVSCDAVSSSMAFHVIIDNAIKYTDKGMIIRVSGTCFERTARISVINEVSTFCITDEDTGKLFTKYYRGEIPRIQKMEGGGIGLYLAKSIMEHNNGSITVKQDGNAVHSELVFQLDRSES